MSLLFAMLLAASQAAPAEPVRYECALALAAGNGQFTAPAPVTISFAIAGKALGDIHVVDAGGILYPGGNMRFVEKADAISLEGATLPAERPGQWRGTVEKKTYRLTLEAGTLAKAAEISVSRTADKKSGRYGLIWNAVNQPEGLRGPISGSGIGNCAISTKDSQ